MQELARLDAEMSSLENDDGKVGRRDGGAREEGSNEERVEMRDGRRQPHPQSCTLEQLYHEALPSPPILSNSGPPNLVYSSASNLFYQVRAKRRENSSICQKSRGMAKQTEFRLT